MELNCSFCNTEIEGSTPDVFAGYSLIHFQCPMCDNRITVIEWDNEETNNENWKLVNTKDRDFLHSFFDEVESEIMDYSKEKLAEYYKSGFEDGSSKEKRF